MSFTKGQQYESAFILNELGAERNSKPYYALHRDGRVLAFALNRWQNPGAPTEIIVGIGESRELYADAFIAAPAIVPVFIKEQRADTLWTCAGYFQFVRFTDTPEEKNARVNPPAIPSVYKILFLTEVQP